MHNETMNLAKIKYLAGDYQILSYGHYVLCAVTGKKIPLEDLTYWSVDRQEAYYDATIAFQRELETNPRLKALLK